MEFLLCKFRFIGKIVQFATKCVNAREGTRNILFSVLALNWIYYEIQSQWSLYHVLLHTVCLIKIQKRVLFYL